MSAQYGIGICIIKSILLMVFNIEQLTGHWLMVNEKSRTPKQPGSAGTDNFFVDVITCKQQNHRLLAYCRR